MPALVHESDFLSVKINNYVWHSENHSNNIVLCFGFIFTWLLCSVIGQQNFHNLCVTLEWEAKPNSDWFTVLVVSVELMTWTITFILWSRVGTVARVLTFHQMCRRFDSRTRYHKLAEFVGSLLYSERFSPGTPVFPSPQKPTFDLSWFRVDLIWIRSPQLVVHLCSARTIEN